MVNLLIVKDTHQRNILKSSFLRQTCNRHRIKGDCYAKTKKYMLCTAIGGYLEFGPLLATDVQLDYYIYLIFLKNDNKIWYEISLMLTMV